jgi:hypothetical protein
MSKYAKAIIPKPVEKFEKYSDKINPKNKPEKIKKSNPKLPSIMKMNMLLPCKLSFSVASNLRISCSVSK